METITGKLSGTAQVAGVLSSQGKVTGVLSAVVTIAGSLNIEALEDSAIVGTALAGFAVLTE